MTTYRIKLWNQTFEDRRARELERLKFVALPVAEDGEGFRMLMSTPEGVQAYGAFIAVVRIAARMKSRGVLRDERGPLTARRLAVLAGMPHEVMEKALSILASDEIGWLEDAEQSDAGASEPHIDGDGEHAAERATNARRSRADAAPTPRRPRADRAPHTEQNSTGQEELHSHAREARAMRADLDAAIDRIPNSELEAALKHYPRWPWDPAKAYDAASDAVNFIAAREHVAWPKAIEWLTERIKAYAEAKKGGTRIQSPTNWLNAHAFDNNPESWQEGSHGRDHQGGGAGVSAGASKRGSAAHEAADTRRSERARSEYPEPQGAGGVRVA